MYLDKGVLCHNLATHPLLFR